VSKQLTTQLESEMDNLNLRIEELEDDKLQLRRENAVLKERMQEIQNFQQNDEKNEITTNIYTQKEDEQ
jgi:Tfp pilus assembly protein PilN